MPTIAANLFASRDSVGVKDNRNFDGWYHIDDHRHILWKKYSQLSVAIKAEVLPPYVFFDSEQEFTLEDKLAPLIEILNKSPQKYMPFIIKPEVGESHYVGGFLRKKAGGKISIVFFNPVGRAELRTNYGRLRTDTNIEIISSAKKVQTTEKDNKRLSSCGPLSLAFVDYAMSNPEYMRTLDKQFNLPPSLNIENYDKNKYREFVLALREHHYQVLTTLTDGEFNKQAIGYDSEVTHAVLDYFDKIRDQDKPAAAANPDGQEYADSWGEAEAGDGDSWGDEAKAEPSNAKSDDEAEDEVLAAKPSPAVPPTKVIDPEQRTDVKFIRSQIERFRENAKSIFSINNVKKADAIEKALNAAIANKVSDVRLDAGVKDALAMHRIFSFFGYKKTAATELNEKSLTTKPIK